MKTHDTPREARKKLLLLEAQLYRLDLMQARQAWRAASREGLLGGTLPAALGAGLKTQAGRLLLTALPLLLRGGTLGRWTRRALLLAGGGAAAYSVFSRWLHRDEAGLTDDHPDHPHDTDATDEKNPGRHRD